MKRVFLILSFALLSHAVHARVVSISENSSVTAIQNKISKLQPGDTLLLKKGYYFDKGFELNSLHGSPDLPITVMGEDRTAVTVNGGAPKPSSESSNYGFVIKNCSWITISNLSMENCWLDAIRVSGSSYITASKLTVNGSRRMVYATGRNSHHFLIEDCYWEQGEHVWNAQGQYNWDELHHGEQRHYNGSIFQGKDISGSFIIRDNYIKNVFNGIRLSLAGADGLDTLAGTNGEIYRNVIENSSDNAFEPEVFSRNLHFYHNKMINSHAFLSIDNIGGGPIYIYGNTGVKLPDCNDGWTILKTRGVERPLRSTMYFFNNSWQTDSDVVGRELQDYWHNDNIRSFNNAYHISKHDSIGIYYLGKNNVFENDCANIPFPAKVAATSPNKSILADPMFVDGKYGNFLLKEGSPCIDAGIIPQDIGLGFTGDKIDIGAFDNGVLVEGPAFRYADPGPEMPEQEKPRIVRHKIEGTNLKLWLSYPLDAASIDAQQFVVHQNNKSYHFDTYSLDSSGCVLVLNSNGQLPTENISVSIGKKPIGLNGEQMVLWASTIPAARVSMSDQVLGLTKKVADQLINSVVFDFALKPVTFNISVVRLTLKEDNVYGKININAGEDVERFLGFSFKGHIEVLLNGKKIYNGLSDSEEFNEYTYNRFHFAHKTKVSLKKGSNLLEVKSLDENISPTLFSCTIQHEDDMVDNTISIKNKICDSYIGNWLVSSDYSGEGVVDWNIQSPTLQHSFIVAPNTNKKGFNIDWSYANSNTLLGIMNLYKASSDARYKEFVAMYNKHIINNYETFRAQYFEKRVLRGAYYRLFRASMLDDVSGSALPFVEMANIEEPVATQKRILDESLDYVLNKQSRLSDGTLCRPEPIDNTVWADDLFMSCTFLLRMAELNNDEKLYDQVASQIINFNKYLKDEQTGLYRHGWYDMTNEQSAVSWSRANGWVIWATSEALVKIPKTHRDYKKIKNIFTDHIKAIVSYQSESGLWHQVLTDADSYLETSGSAMFAIGLARGLNGGWLPAGYEKQLLLAWDGISKQIDDSGAVHNICCGTEIKDDVDYYRNQPTMVNDPRGMGAVITLGTEMGIFFKKH